mgnify:FL=1
MNDQEQIDLKDFYAFIVWLLEVEQPETQSEEQSFCE